jgi:alkylhydroperoxidase/carboxymuconolactone decarboxylase family protein YurZ
VEIGPSPSPSDNYLEDYGMSQDVSRISKAFLAFRDEAPNHAKAWMQLVQDLAAASALDSKTGELAYISVLAAMGRESGIPYHVHAAKKLGATRDAIVSAILVGLPVVGHGVTQVLPAAIEAYDEE